MGRAQGDLDAGQPWLSSDKLKAVRLLGKQPFDALDDRDVAMVFLASWVLKPVKTWDWEISTELTQNDTREFRNNAAIREFDSIKPQDPATARAVLLALIERATQRLALQADAHRERARLLAALAPDILAFDESVGGERLRRYELMSGRALARSLDELRKHRRSPVVRGQLSVVSGEVEPSAEPLAPNEATDCCMPAAVPTAQHSIDEGQATIGGETETPDEPVAPNEATDNEWLDRGREAAEAGPPGVVAATESAERTAAGDRHGRSRSSTRRRERVAATPEHRRTVEWRAPGGRKKKRRRGR